MVVSTRRVERTRHYDFLAREMKPRSRFHKAIMAASMLVGSVIIVSHNSGAYIGGCLQSLDQFPDWKIIVVDNASSDDSIQEAERSVARTHIVRNLQNLGFAAAINQGAKSAEGDVLVILNPDTLAASGSMDELARALQESDVGAVSGRLSRADGVPEIGFTVRRFPDLRTMLSEVLLLNRVWPRNPWNNHYRCFDLDYTQYQDVDQPAGACLAIKREAWEEVGEFDERFFPVWFEDVDFCKRLRNAGWRIRYCPEAVFVHAGGHSVKALRFGDRQAFWYKNLLLYFSKHHRRWELNTLRAGVAAGLMLRALLSLVGFRTAGVSVKAAGRGYWNAAWHYAIRGLGL